MLGVVFLLLRSSVSHMSGFWIMSHFVSQKQMTFFSPSLTGLKGPPNSPSDTPFTDWWMNWDWHPPPYPDGRCPVRRVGGGGGCCTRGAKLKRAKWEIVTHPKLPLTCQSIWQMRITSSGILREGILGDATDSHAYACVWVYACLCTLGIYPSG